MPAGTPPTALFASTWIATQAFILSIHVLVVTCFAYIVARRLIPLSRAERDFRFDHPKARLRNVLKFWLGQWKHPRYRTAGVLPILIFTSFPLFPFRVLVD